MPTPSATTHFVILIGGPGKYKGCDPEHDQSWSNYLVPIQIATKNKLLHKDPNEIIHWFVYGPAYSERWTNDYATPPVNPALAANRKAKADKVVRQGSTNYLDRIRQIAANLGVRFKIINTPQDFWVALAAFPDNSISRVWYSGHASGSGLMLKLIHLNDPHDCRPRANNSDMIDILDISSMEPIVGPKFIKRSGKKNKFIGCFTNEFAKKWSNTFKVTAQGAINKIDFSVTDRPSNVSNIIFRLQTSNPNTGWKTHTPPPVTVTAP